MSAASETATAARERPSGLTIAVGVISLIGICVATYLVYIHYAKINPLCVASHGGHSSCLTVQSSIYSKLAGIPVADLGLAGYVVILVSLFIPGDLGRAIGFGVALTGFGFSMYLTYREIFTIKAICEWCVSSAIMMTILMILTGIRFIRAES